MKTTNVVYEPQLVARDPHKSYPHGFGFTPPLLNLMQADELAEVYALNYFKTHYKDTEFDCIAVIPREVHSVLALEIMGSLTPEETTEQVAPPLTPEDLATGITGASAEILYSHYINTAHSKNVEAEDTLSREAFATLLDQEGQVLELGYRYTIQ